MNNKEILQAANEAIKKGDHETFLQYCTEDTKWIFIGDQTLIGKENVRAYMKDAYLEPPKFNIETILEDNDYVVATGKISLKNKNGDDIQYSYCDIWRFENGKMAELKAFVIA
ncbi:nuclear transport factor 2 family protein [Chryseobacterium sp. GMJ5]|uniref:Nuclear transport factor 2 family protein n=1 Tax=Chryseobacterium gilvum TaxID=2976534 RepID=A0ABT2VYE7_9FLAO|nr:nuclear transport factor 2 family protein [Chryseobacterium gilvum]MCU7615024.1 nuclear transport factor 2 family protein [Chryseobacterium gilvum]